MKSVLLSIQPKWCELIASGKKTVEIRKTKPKLETPFKCYIYCTAGDRHNALLVNGEASKVVICDNYKTAIPVGGYIGNGKVIGEFVCDEILDTRDVRLQDTCMTVDEWLEYSAGHLVMYGWHISDLKIYDKPKKLNEFKKKDTCQYLSSNGCTYKYHCFRSGETKRCGGFIKRAPQSWCYVC